MSDSEQSFSAVALVQNPAFGALLLWTFGNAYQKEKITDIPVLPLHFLVLPLVLHAGCLGHISSTMPSSGLGQLARKLADQREELFAVHQRAISMRGLTLEAVGSGVAAGILTLDYRGGRLRSNDARPPKEPERLKRHVRGAEKLGKWFARLEPNQVFGLLRVEP